MTLKSMSGFNPCCNGKCSGSQYGGEAVHAEQVSILVVMESAQEAETVMEIIAAIAVSILVVMESAQEERLRRPLSWAAAGFNPCCNGKCSGS